MAEPVAPTRVPDFETSLRAALAEANVPTLQVLTIQLTGDERWIQPPFTPTRCRGIDENDSGGLSEELQDEETLEHLRPHRRT